METGRRPGRKIDSALLGLFALGASAAIPPIDAAAPVKTETATFALG